MKKFFELSRFYFKLFGKKLYPMIFLILLASLFQGLGLSLFVPIVQGDITNNKISILLKNIFTYCHIPYKLFYLLLALFVFYSIRSICLILQKTYVARIKENKLAELRNDFVKRIFKINYETYMLQSIGYLNNALTIELPKALLSFQRYSILLTSFCFVIVYLTLPFIINPKLMLFILFLGIPFYWIIKKINFITTNNSTKVSSFSAGLQKILIQALNNYKYLRTSNEYLNVLKQISSKTKNLAKLESNQEIFVAISEHAFDPLAILFLSSIVYYYVEIKGQNLMESAFVLFLLYNAIIKLFASQTMFRKFWGSIDVIINLENKILKLEKDSELKDESEIGIKDFNLNKPITIKNLDFAYSNDIKVFKSINATIMPNTTVAFVGESGSGKTTLLNLLVGLLNPKKGDILIDDYSLKDLNISEFRKQIGYIIQESVIFNDTIRNNIALWKNEINDTHLEKICKQAKIFDFINNQEKKFDTLLGENGLNISGGQRQRIGIARELYKNPKIIIFDEATSALDSKTKIEIQKDIDNLHGEKTIIIVAHRLSSIKKADKIFVLNNGQIVEEGSFSELIKLNGVFTNMVSKQV